jgi:hypothetical protein
VTGDAVADLVEGVFEVARVHVRLDQLATGVVGEYVVFRRVGAAEGGSAVGAIRAPSGGPSGDRPLQRASRTPR